MPSMLSRVVRVLAYVGGNNNPELAEKSNKDVVKMLRGAEVLFPVMLPRRGYKLKKRNIDGVPTDVFSKKKNASENVVFYLHGGAYISHMMFYYRLLYKRFSKASGGGTVVAHDYRCAPEYKYPAALEDTLKVWDWLLEQGYQPENIVLAGDSAGGNLGFELMMTLHDAGKPMPRAAVFMSPWLDMTCSGKSYLENYRKDPVFGNWKSHPKTIEEVQAIMARGPLYSWVGDHAKDEPIISPVYADFDNTYPPMFFTAGGIEMLRSDSETIVEKLQKAGVEANLHVFPGQVHAFPVYQVYPEAMQALKEIFAFVRTQFDVKN